MRNEEEKQAEVKQGRQSDSNGLPLTFTEGQRFSRARVSGSGGLVKFLILEFSIKD